MVWRVPPSVVSSGLATLLCLTAAPPGRAGQAPGTATSPAQPPAATAPATPPSLEEQIESLFAERKFKDAIPLAEQLVATAERTPAPTMRMWPTPSRSCRTPKAARDRRRAR